MSRKTLLLAGILSASFLSVQAQSGRFTCATMNVDGLPPSVNINYIFGNYTIEVNPDGREDAGARAIGEKMLSMGLDFIGVNEDFNYHKALMEPLTPAGYEAYTHRGGMSVNEAGGLLVAVGNYLAKKPLVRADGLNLICRRQADAGFPTTKAAGENIVAWTDAYGYTEAYHDNDALTTKGFRYYRVTTGDDGNTCDLDVYILHMDAGSGWKDGDDGDIYAREKQMTQLVKHIREKVTTRPIIIMGDFNSYYTRDRLKELFIDPIEAINDGQLKVSDCWVELSCEGVFPEYDLAKYGYNSQKGECIDKILYVNNSASPVQLVLEHFRIDSSFVSDDGTPLSDHKPAVARFAFYSSPVSVGTLAHTIRDVQTGRATQADLDREVQRVLEDQ